jgi:replicative DNA helicase
VIKHKSITDDLKESYKHLKFGRIIDIVDLPEIYLKYAENLEQKKVFFGFPTIDRAMGGIRPTQKVTINSRTNVGKTSVITNILANQVGTFDPKKEQILMFSLEISEEEIFERLIQMEMEMSTSEIEKKAETRDQDFIRNSKEILKKYQSMTAIVYRIGIDEIGLYNKSLEEITGKRTRLMLIDYLQIIDNPKANEYSRISVNARKEQEIALHHKTPIIDVSQIGRKEGKLTLHAGKGSGEIEEAANIVISLETIECPADYPDDIRKKIEEERYDLLDFSILKKKAGKKAKVHLLFDKKSLRMREYSKPPIIDQTNIIEGDPF